MRVRRAEARGRAKLTKNLLRDYAVLYIITAKLSTLKEQKCRVSCVAKAPYDLPTTTCQ